MIQHFSFVVPRLKEIVVSPITFSSPWLTMHTTSGDFIPIAGEPKVVPEYNTTERIYVRVGWCNAELRGV